MFDFLTKGLEYNKLAKALSNTIVCIDKLQSVYNQTYERSAVGPGLFDVAFRFKNEVIDRMDKYNWPSTSPVFLDKMKKHSLGEAVSIATTKIYLLAEDLDVKKYVIEILNEGDTYYKMKNAQ